MNKITKVEREALSVGRILFGSLLLVIGVVVLGFAISEWATHAKERELAAAVRRSVALEVADNLKTMEAQAKRHYAALEKLHRVTPIAGHTAFQTLFENLHGDLGAPMKRAAWDAAVSSGALRLLDHELVERYSEIYVDQQRVYDDDGAWLKAALYRPENFDPAQQALALATLSGALTELAGDEAYMRDLYRRQLPALQKAAQ
jgi:hypothetical protein